MIMHIQHFVLFLIAFTACTESKSDSGEFRVGLGGRVIESQSTNEVSSIKITRKIIRSKVFYAYTESSRELFNGQLFIIAYPIEKSGKGIAMSTNKKWVVLDVSKGIVFESDKLSDCKNYLDVQ